MSHLLTRNVLVISQKPIHDVAGTEVGRITKKWAGILREGFTTADRYLLHISGDVSGPLRTLMVASAAGVDTALKQDDTGGFGFGGIDIDMRRARWSSP
jgi:hypothetical protein